MFPYRALAVLSLLSPLSGAQITIHVPSDAPTIQAGIDGARDGDTVLVAPGTYLEFIEFRGKAITVRSEAGAAATTIDAQNNTPVVGFLAGEDERSVLRGFTITGGNGGQPGVGIQCLGTTPLIQGCVVRGNRSFFGIGAGVFGDPTLEDCTIENNVGGGVFGAPTMRRCVVRGNSAYDGAGLQLLGGRIEDTQILENLADEGSSGGAVSIMGKGIVLLRCTIARNVKNGHGQYVSTGSGLNAGPGTLPLIVSCTIVSNIVGSPPPPGFCGSEPCPDYGGIFGPARLVNTIVRDNDGEELDPSSGFTAVYSNIEGGLAGHGNFDADPLFRDPEHGDFRLLPGSPCIDTGAPLSPLDLDGSRADVGAEVFAHAVAFVRNGSGVNPRVLSGTTPPLVGATWNARIDASGFPGARFSGIVGRSDALILGQPTVAGELLIDPASRRLFQITRPSTGALDDFAVSIPPALSLLGLVAHVQGFVAGRRTLLTNALELHVGL